jgi:hypothetical protein
MRSGSVAATIPCWRNQVITSRRVARRGIDSRRTSSIGWLCEE